MSEPNPLRPRPNTPVDPAAPEDANRDGNEGTRGCASERAGAGTGACGCTNERAGAGSGACGCANERAGGREGAGAGAGGRASRWDDLAYVAPMAAFLVLTQVGNSWPGWFPLVYAAKTLVAGALLVFFWRRYTPICWNWAWLGVLVGGVGLVQWVGMEELLRAYWPNYPRLGGGEAFDPYQQFTSPWALGAFIAVRWAGPVLVVPLMEELFWRDWLWRNIAAPADFKLAKVGEWDPAAFLVVAGLFATVHPMWMTAVVWGLLIGGLLLYTRSLGACIIAHAVTNFLLGAYVLWTHKWYYW